MTVQRSSRLLLLGASLLALCSFAGSVPSKAFGADYGLTFADVVNRVRNSVVTVAAAVVDKHSFAMKGKKGAGEDQSSERGSSGDFSPSRPKQRPGEPPRQFTSIGSGFIIDASGLVVTNNHVIEGGNAIYVILADGTELKVDKVLGRDPKTDIRCSRSRPRRRATPPRIVRRLLQDQGGRLGARHRQSVRARRHRDRRDSFRAAAGTSMPGPYDDFLQTDASSTGATRAARSSTRRAR